MSDLNEAFLKSMEVGSVLHVENHGHLVEIHRVPDGWIYVFQLNQSVLNSVFIEEVEAWR